MRKLFRVVLCASLAMPAITHARNGPLEKLVERCDDVPMNHGACGNLAKPVWLKVTAATGEVTKIDTTSAHPVKAGGTIVTAYTYPPSSKFDFSRLQSLYFNCRGQFSDMRDAQRLQDAPPRSVAGSIAALVCPSPRSPAATRIMREWDAANDACQGGNVSWRSPICQKRDNLQRRAKAVGWCWSYDDWKITRADYHWHRCADRTL